MKISRFVKILLAVIVVPIVAAVVIGELYKHGLVTDHGLWVDAVMLLMRFEMDKVEFVAVAAAGLYIAIFAALGGLQKAYNFGRWTMIKAFLALTVVPTFFFTLSWFIPTAEPLRAPSATVSFEGLLVAIGLNIMLP